MTRPHRSIAREYIDGSVHCEPTWKVKPYGRSPNSGAMLSSRTASSADVPNLRDSGNRLWESSTSSRTYTAEPGAAAGQLVELAFGVDREAPHPSVDGPPDVLLGFHGVAEQDVLGSHADRFERFQLVHGGDLEPGPTFGERRQHRQRGVALEREVRPDARASPGRTHRSGCATSLAVGGEKRRVEADLVQRLGLEPDRPGLPTRRARLKQMGWHSRPHRHGDAPS